MAKIINALYYEKFPLPCHHLKAEEIQKADEFLTKIMNQKRSEEFNENLDARLQKKRW